MNPRALHNSFTHKPGRPSPGDYRRGRCPDTALCCRWQVKWLLVSLSRLRVRPI